MRELEPLDAACGLSDDGGSVAAGRACGGGCQPTASVGRREAMRTLSGGTAHFLQHSLTPRCAASWPAGIGGEASLPLLPTVVGPKVKGSLAGEATLESEGRRRAWGLAAQSCQPVAETCLADRPGGRLAGWLSMRGRRLMKFSACLAALQQALEIHLPALCTACRR